MAIVLGLAYAMALYFQAATASLTDDYQPGIGLLITIVSPTGLLLATLLVACLRKTGSSARIAVLTCAGAVAVSVLLLAFVHVHEGAPGTWRFPESRSLGGTVRLAVFQPRFSNRSEGSVVGSGVCAALLLAASVRLARRRRRRSPSAPTPLA